MFTDQALLFINIACIFFLVVMLIVLVIATRMKGGAGWAAAIIVTTTVPVYLANLFRDLASEHFLWFWYPSTTLNLLCFPSLWLFVQSQFDKTFRFSKRNLLHLFPALISLGTSVIFYAPMSAEQIEIERAFMEAGGENLPALVNDIFLFGLFFVYFAAIFRYMRKRKKQLRDNYADSDYCETRWVTSFIILFFIFFFIVFVAYVIDPRTDTWLIPILNTLGMAYLVFVVVRHSNTEYINRLAVAPAETEIRRNNITVPTMSKEQMKEISDRLTDYLVSSKAYTNPDLSLSMLSVDTGIASKNISRAINGYLNKSFFDLINEMRVDEAKKRLRQLDMNSHTIDSVADECGFSSRSSFFAAFKKVEGKTPSQWLKTGNNY